MPFFVPVQTRTGVVNYNCTISTPKMTETEAIDPDLPTIMFMHGPYLPMMTFQSQFVDPLLRKFNLVTFDLRAHGETVGAKIPKGYSCQDVADEVVQIMNAMKIPACHIMALSISTAAALDIASRHPERVLSLLLVSPFGMEETDFLKEAHHDIHRCWNQGYPDSETVLEDVLKDAFYGCMQFGFSGKQSAMADACLAVAFVYAENHGAYNKLEEYRNGTLYLMNDRKPFTQTHLSRIKCPVRFFLGGADIAHPREWTEQLMQKMREVGCDVTLTFVPEAPHLVSIDHPHVTNPVLHSLVMEQCTKPIPDAPKPVFSPWTPILREAGWIPEGEDEDEDGFIMHYQGFSNNVL